MVGPELTSGTLEAIAALTSTDCAPPLGSHPAVGKLVAIRYGAALADPQIAAMVARGKSGSAQSATNGGAPAAGHAEVLAAGHAEVPAVGHAEVPAAGNAEAPTADEGAEALPASAPPAGTSAQ
jgi:hypothetical protein